MAGTAITDQQGEARRLLAPGDTRTTFVKKLAAAGIEHEVRQRLLPPPGRYPRRAEDTRDAREVIHVYVGGECVATFYE